MSANRDALHSIKLSLEYSDGSLKPKQTRAELTKAVRLADENYDTKMLLPCVLKHLPSDDAVCKKLAFWFILNHGSHSHILLAINSLVKDCQDASPIIRGAALRALTQLTQPDLIEYSIQATIRALRDSSCYVRRIAVLGCAKVHRLQPHFTLDRGVIDQLYSMIRDSDPIVMLNCLRSLEEILRNDGGIVINRKIHNFLLNRLLRIPTGLLGDVVPFLKRYAPGESEVFDIMNICDEFLNHNEASVVLPFLQYLLHLTRDLGAVNTQVLQRAREPLMHLLSHSTPQLVFVLLDLIDKIYFEKHREMLIPSYSSFLCKQNEPSYVKVKRLTLVCSLASDSNIVEILDELYVQATTGSNALVRHAIHGFSLIAAKSNQYLPDCLKKLVKLLSLQRLHINGPVIAVLSQVNLVTCEDDILHDIMHQVCKCVLLDESMCARTDVLWLLGEYCECSSHTAYILEHYVTQFEAWQDPELCTNLMTTAIKLFMKKPAQSQHVLGQIFESALHKGNFITQQTVKYYYSLLLSDINAAKMLLVN